MFGKKATALIISVLLSATIFISGGCGGSSSSASKKLAVVGTIKPTDSATLSENNVELVSGDKEHIFASRNVLIADFGTETSAKKSEVKEMFDIDGEATVSLYEPTSADITELKALLGVEETSVLNEDTLIEDEETSGIVTFSILRYADGSIQSYAEINHEENSKYQLVRDDSIRKEDVDAGKVWVRYNNASSADVVLCDVIKYVLGDKIEDTEDSYYIAEEQVIGTVAVDAVVIDEEAKTITVPLNGVNYDCLNFKAPDCTYTVARPGIELPDDAEKELDETPVPARGPADELETELTSRETNITSFAGWLCSGKTQTLSANAGAETLLAKAAVWVKETFTGTACADSQEPAELFDVAWKAIGKVGRTFDNLPGLNISVTTTIASTHHFDEDSTGKTGGNDYYYVKQSCVVNNGMEHRHWYQSGKYKPIKLKKAFGQNDWFWVGGAECDEFYLSKYRVEAELVSDLRYPAVNCIKANPQAYNRETTKTASHGWNVGVSGHGGTAHDALDAGLALSFGYESKKSESYSTYDVECKLNNGHNVVSWEYPVTRLPERAKRWTRLTHPADLAISTYQPAQCYIWQIPTSERSKYTKLRNTISTQVSGAYSRNSGSLRERHVDYTVSASGDITLPKPPLFCLDKQTVNFDEKTAKTAYVTVYSQGNWAYDSSTVPDWLELTRTDENYQLTVVAQPNTTGKTRTAVIKLKREDGSEKWDNRTITVTQSPYSK